MVFAPHLSELAAAERIATGHLLVGVLSLNPGRAVVTMSDGQKLEVESFADRNRAWHGDSVACECLAG
jgi:hypothetical protein